MWKPLVVLAIVANTVLITPTEGYNPGPYSIEEHGNSHRKCKNPNEEYDLCLDPCPPRECGVNKALILCAPSPKPGSSECKPGCRCADGFLRNRAGVCIPENQCKYDCAKNETLDPCVSDCPPRYCGVNIAAVSCLAIDECDCQPGCRCSDGYLRNGEGNCVLEEDCPRCPGLNQRYNVCPAPCPPRRCGVDDNLVDCAPPPNPGDPECEPGCECELGFVRNYDGVCVTRDQCPTCGGAHEEFDICPAPCPPRRCDVDERLIRCAKPPEPGDESCEPGCRCSDGYVRNERGVCVTRDQCPYNCGPYEIYSKCPTDECRPLDCTQVGFPVSCPIDKDDDDGCPVQPGCICEYGYVKNENGTCIPISECPACGGDPFAITGCGVNCGRHCSDLKKKKPVPCIEICYENACDCREGYYYDNNTKKCVKPEDCTPVCGRNEVYSNCTNADCRPKDCSQLGFPIKCPRINPVDCVKGCLCKEGYVRGANGKCIRKERCPSCGGDTNAVTGCGVNCGRLCSNYNKGPVSCIAVCYENACDCKKGFVLDESTGKCILPNQCVSCRGDFHAQPGCDRDCTKRCPGPKPAECKCYKDGCVCKDGFLYDPKAKKCVRPEQCTPPCGDNEVLSNCSNGGCGPWTCDDVGFPTGCVKMDQKYCTVGCVCKEGYVRQNGVCVSVTDCPTCGGDPNARPGCGVNCGRLCSNYNKGPVACLAVCYDNACDCKKGYVLDENTGLCVRPKDCTPICGKNEKFSNCVNGGCEAKNCSQVGEPVPCVKPAKCKPGCLCADGYLRADNGTCVPKDQCPPKCYGANEMYDPCPPSCPPQTCESIGQKYFCPLQPADQTSKNCRGACRCKPNYFRNKIGECISAKNCKKCKGPKEYFSCGGACDNVCATLKKQNQTNCPIINIQCNEMCYCEEGYARNASNICIPIDQCPENNCGVNERYEQCPARLCTPQSCSDLGFDLQCEDIGDGPCSGPPGCVCDYNYVRDGTGKCIPDRECPSCGGDENAERGCGLNCGRLCSNYDKGPVPCPRICYPNFCDCKKGFVYDENIKKCVRPKDCTPICGKHEVFSECTNGGCKARNCAQLGKPVPCVKLDPKSCIKGCVCEDGYLRARNGSCVPEDKCDHCNKPHEHYEPCSPSCPPQTCESIGKQYKCPPTAAVCKGSCRCDEGYLRNKIGQCIRRKDCLKCTGPNEYHSCGGACDNVCATLHKQNQTNCPIINIKCNEMCYCEQGYARDSSNICIPIDKCPKPVCGVNERLEQCPPALCTPQKCSELGFPYPCVDLPPTGCPEPPGCVCIDDYVRDAKGRCIPNQNCPSCGGDSKAVSGCGLNCGRTCADYNRTDVVCPAVCYFNACDCRKGYVYDANIKKCVKPKDCTPVCRKHEVYDSCANGGCGKRNCTQLGEPDLCIDVIKCIGGCVCQEGYLRAANGRCVPINKCPPPKCGINERFELCPDSICEPQRCSELGFPIPCSVLSGDSSCPGRPACICDYGFVRNDYGICVPKNQCPSCGGDKNAQPGCGINCGRLCSNYNKGPVPCPKICKFNSCDCKKGFVFDVNTKKCVRPRQCTPTCGDNEVYSPCINGVCQAKNCSQVGKPVPCPKIDSKRCVKGCLCKEGYLRDKNGVCVPKDQCSLPKCRENERLEDCPDQLCTPQSCSQLGFPIDCPALTGDSTESCPGKPGCVCIDDYVRDDSGKCIPTNECPSCGGDANAVSGCGQNCGRLCSNYKKKGVVCPLICKLNGCDCRNGYVYDSNLGKCVRPKDCTPTCGNNEVYVNCANGGCEKRNCSQVDELKLCIDPIKCFGGCVCKEGFLRNKNGTCVPEDQCPRKCPGPNEHYACGSACDNVCSTLSKQNQTNCPIVNKRCNNKCYCNKGYARDDNGICIPIEQCGVSCNGDSNAIPGCGGHCGRRCSTYNKGVVACPLSCQLNGCDCKQSYVYDDNLKKCVQPKDCTPVCKKNEVFEKCANGGCNRRKCADLLYPKICKDPIECVGDCVCVKGYLRNEDGLCVPENECKPKCNRPHQVFEFCPSTCPPRTCESLDRAYVCPIEWGQEPPCQPGCVCEQGYYTNKKGECISEENCLKCTRPNELYSCGGACDNVCATLNEQNQTNCPIVNVKCNEMCYCEEGYARNASNICIPIKDCPPPRCGDDERYEVNPSFVCEPLYCSEVGQPMDCPPVVDPNCDDEPACICKSGLVRNDDDVCVPIEECPSTNTTVTCTDARARLDKGSINLAGDFLHYLVSTKPDENCAASGTSLLIPLAQLALGATRAVLEELLKLLHLKSKDEIKCIFPDFTKELGNQENVELEVATKCYANIGYPLRSNFIGDSYKYFYAEAQNLDFGQNVAASKTINGWVSNRTHGKIQDLVNPDMFSSETRLCLINAIYFLGDWLYKFNPNDTTVKDFYKANGDVVQLKIMYQQGTFNYAENDNFQAVEMFYKGKNISFLAVLPRTKTGLLDVVKTLRDPDEFSKLTNNLQSKKVEIYMPKFFISTQTDIKDMFIKDNKTAMFGRTSNGFEGILERNEPVYVTDAVQKAYISVDEKGTEATAATAIIITRRSLPLNTPPPYVFNANHPFLFYIKTKDMILFCGTFVK